MTMTVHSYPTGTEITVRASFGVESVPATVPISYTLTDPGAVTLKVRDPAGNVTLYAYGSGDGVIVKEATGQYRAYVTLTIPGPWYYHWVGTGAAVGVGEQRVFAEPVAVA